MEFLLGQIFQFSFPGGTANWMECAGQTLQVMQYQPLFSLIGAKFGGDGRTTFCLPDLRSAQLAATPLKYYMCVQGGLYPVRS